MSARGSEKIRILIVDDMEPVRQSLRTILQLTDDFQVVGEACNGREAIHAVESIRPDVVLMDLEMPVLGGLEATRQIKQHYPEIGVVIITIHDSSDAKEKAAQVGADAFVGKESETAILIETIREISS
jgi:DNA-binding NarL/FixJ family response regulator